VLALNPAMTASARAMTSGSGLGKRAILIYLAEGLRPFVEGKPQEFHGDGWEEVTKDCLDDKQFHIQDGKVNLPRCPSPGGLSGKL